MMCMCELNHRSCADWMIVRELISSRADVRV